MTDTADRIAYLRDWVTAMPSIPVFQSQAILALCDDYETLAARCTLTDDETEAVRLYAGGAGIIADEVRAVLRRLLGDTP